MWLLGQNPASCACFAVICACLAVRRPPLGLRDPMESAVCLYAGPHRPSHNPSTSQHNPLTIAHNPSTFPHNPSTNLTSHAAPTLRQLPPGGIPYGCSFPLGVDRSGEVRAALPARKLHFIEPQEFTVIGKLLTYCTCPMNTANGGSTIWLKSTSPLIPASLSNALDVVCWMPCAFRL